MGVVKIGCAVVVGAVAVGFGILKGPANPISLEVVDFVDRLLDKAQGSLEDNKQNRYLNGIFAPTLEEINVGAGLELEVISGALPDGLDGIFLRVGPNPWAAPTKRHHVFDGDGMIHSLRIKNGKAFYHNAYLATPRLQFEKKRGHAFFQRIGEMTGFSGLAKVLLLDKAKGAGLGPFEVGQANTALSMLPDGRLWALHEGSWPFEFKVSERGEVSSIGTETASGLLTTSVSAHPKVDRRTEDIFFHAYMMDGGADRKTYLAYGHFDKDVKLQEYFPLMNVSGPSFSHDMLLSEHYTIIMDTSIRFSPEKMVSGGSIFSFDSKHRARIAVVPRTAKSSTEVRWFETPVATGWVHPLHAWEENNGKTLVLWAPLAMEANRTGGVIEGCCDLWHVGEIRIDLETGTVTMDIVDKAGAYHGEFSRIRDDLIGQGAVRFGFTGASDRETKEDFDFIGFTKWDFQERKAAKELFFEKGWIGGEPIFIPKVKESGDRSDDGYLANFLYGSDANSTDFALFDARTMSPEPVVRLRVPKRVPVGFHGTWVTRNQLDKHLKRKA